MTETGNTNRVDIADHQPPRFGVWTNSRKPKNTGQITLTAALLLQFSLTPLVQAGEISYQVQQGDNPWSISTRFLRSTEFWPRLIKHNRIRNPRQILPGTRLSIPDDWLKLRSGPAVALAVEGQVWMTIGDVRQQRLLAGDTVPVGATLKTGAEGNVTLNLLDSSRVLIKGNSEVLLEANAEAVHGMARNILLNLRRGALENQINQQSSSGGRFEIRTPAAIAAVRGTRFRVAAQDTSTRTEVLHGAVALGNPIGQVELAVGQGSSTSQHSAPTAPTPLLNGPDLTQLPLRVEKVPIDLPIPALSGALAYRTQIAANDAFNSLLFDQTTSIPIARVRDLPDGDYVLRVRAIDATGLEGFDSVHRLTIDARPEAPFLISPAEAAKLANTQPRFSWTRRQDGSSYRLQLASDAEFKHLVFDRNGIAEAHLEAPESLPAGVYHWRIAAIAPQEGQGPFGAAQSFRRVPDAPAIALQSTDQRPVIRWRPGGPDERFQFQVANNAQFSDPVVEQTLSAPDQPLPTLAEGRYFLRARTIAGDGYIGDWSSLQQFEIAGPSRAGMLILLLPLLLGL
jgi:hypothetical protein